jgi:hypothetical protein
MILKNDHVITSIHLEVLPYYESLGPVSANSCEQPCWIQPSIKVPFDMRVIRFVLSRVGLRTKFERAVADICPCRLVWPDMTVTDETPVEIHFEAPVGGIAATAATTKRCESVLVDLLNSIEIRTIGLLQETWSRFKSCIESSPAKIIADDDVSVECDDQACAVTVIGHGRRFEEVAARLLDEKSALEADFQRRKVSITESVKLPRLKMDLLKACGFLDQSNDSQLKLEIRNDKVVASGLAEDVNEWKLKVLELLAGSVIRTINVDDYVLKALQKEPFRNHLIDTLKAKSVTGVVWECSSTDVSILAIDEQQV